MKPTEVTAELESIRLRLYRLRRSNHAHWFQQLILAIEVLVKATIRSVECVTRSTSTK